MNNFEHSVNSDSILEHRINIRSFSEIIKFEENQNVTKPTLKSDLKKYAI